MLILTFVKNKKKVEIYETEYAAELFDAFQECKRLSEEIEEKNHEASKKKGITK